MDELILVEPSLAYTQQLFLYKKESLAHHPKIHGGNSLEAFEEVSDWLQYLEDKKTPELRPPGHVPDSTYLCIRSWDKRVVGIVNIRHELSDHLLHFGGHIGYSVRPGDRGRGYGVLQLKMALQECAKLSINPVLLTCTQDNQISGRVIQNCGGVLEDMQISPEGEVMQRWWITI